MNSFDLVFESLESKGWACQDGLLPSQLVQSLQQECQELWHKEQFVSAQVGKGSQKSHRPEIRGDAICWLDSKVLSASEFPGVHQFFDWTEELRRALNRHFFLGLNSEEFHFARYPAGAGYHAHLDQHAGTLQRKISFVLYLNPAWSDEDGGQLVIHSDEGAQEKILPRAGRLVLFRSDQILHEVLPCFQTRWSLTGWFRAEVQSLP